MEQVTVTNLDAHKEFQGRVGSLERFEAFVKGGTAVLVVLIGVAVWKWPAAGEPGRAGKDAVDTPVGSIVAWMTDVAPPDGWCVCDGRKIDDIRVTDEKDSRKKRPLDNDERAVLLKSTILKNGVALPDLTRIIHE